MFSMTTPYRMPSYRSLSKMYTTDSFRLLSSASRSFRRTSNDAKFSRYEIVYKSKFTSWPGKQTCPNSGRTLVVRCINNPGWRVDNDGDIGT